MNIEPRQNDATDKDYVLVSIINNPLNPTDVTHYRGVAPSFGLSLKECIDDRADLIVAHNGIIQDKERFGTTMVKPGDHLTICPILTGDDDSKMVMRFVATAVVTYYTGVIGAQYGLGWAMAFSLVGGFLVNTMLPIKPLTDPTPDPLNSSPSYGIDSGQNTARQGEVVPVVYGTARVVPNRVGLYTELIGDTSNQNLYLLFAMAEGEIDGIDTSSILINNQPITTLPTGDITVGGDRLGTQDQLPPEFFASGSITPVERTDIVLDLTYVDGAPVISGNDQYFTHVTTQAVTQFRLDFVAPGGLYFADKGTGNTGPQDVTFDITYRLSGTSDPWVRLYQPDPWRLGLGMYRTSSGNPSALTIEPLESYLINTVHRTYVSHCDGLLGGSPMEQSMGVMKMYMWPGSPDPDIFDTDTISMIMPAKQPYYNVVQDPAEYFYYPDGGTRYTYYRHNHTGDSYLPRMVGFQSSAVRASFMSPKLATGVYEIRVRAIPPCISGLNEARDFFRVWQTRWSYVNEINDSATDTAYVNTAMMSMRIKLGERLNTVPNISAVVRGRKIKTFSRAVGTFDVVENPPALSDNPAWIAYDMLTDERIGAGMDPARIDFAKWLDWAEYCVSAGLKFNAVFQSQSSLYEALQYVLRAGHAQLITVGTRFSVAIERPDQPVMMFNVGSIIKDTMSVNWLPREERVNEVEVSYIEPGTTGKDYKQNSVVVRDPDAPVNAQQRVHRFNAYWITDLEQAKREAAFELNQNKFVNHVVQFDAPMEAIACTVGDQILLQHDMPNWNKGGRLASGSTTTALALDREVTIEALKTYKALVHFDAQMRYSGTVVAQAVTGLTTYTSTAIYVNGVPTSAASRSPVKRLKIGGQEYAVLEIRDYSGGTAVILEAAITVTVGDAYELWDADSIEERDVTSAAGTYTNITVSPALPSAPSQFAKWVFGESALVKRAYRVKAIESRDKYIRTIKAVEYNENSYVMDNVIADSPATAITGIGNVSDISLDRRLLLSDAVYNAEVLVSWHAPTSGAYGGADIYVAREGSTEGGAVTDMPFELIASVRNGRMTYSFKAVTGERMWVKVVAVDVFGVATRDADPPMAYIEISGDLTAPATPTALSTTSEINAVVLKWVKPTDPDFKAVRLYRGTTNVFANATMLAELDSESVLDAVAPGTTYYYFLTAVDFTGNESTATAGVAGAARQATGTDIAPGSIDYNTQVVNAPPQYQVLDTPTNGELFQYRSHLTGTRTTYPTTAVATKRPLESPFGTDCYAIDTATENLMGTHPAVTGGLALTAWATVGGSDITITQDADGYYRMTNAGGVYEGIKGSVLAANMTNGSAHTGSLYVQNPSTSPVTIKWQALGNAEQTRTLAGLEEFRISNTNTAATWDATNNYIQVKVEAGKAVRLVQPQVEKLNYASSFTTGVRAKGHISYGSYGADKDHQQSMLLGWNKFQVAGATGGYQFFYGVQNTVGAARKDGELVVLWVEGAVTQEWHTGLMIPNGDLDWHLWGVEFDKANDTIRAFLDDQVATRSTPFAFDAVAYTEFVIGDLTGTSASPYTAQSLVSNVQVIFGAENHLTPDEVKQVYNLRKPFSDTAARVDTPEPTAVTLEFV